MRRFASFRKYLSEFARNLRYIPHDRLTFFTALCYNPFVPKIKTEKSGPRSGIRAEREYAKSIGVPAPTRLNKEQLDEAVRRRELELGITGEKHSIYDFTPEERKTLESGLRGKHRAYRMVSGYFRAFPEGDGVLRRDPFAILPEADTYIPASYVRACDIREGDRITGVGAVLFYNKIRVLKSVHYVDGDSKRRSPLRTDYAELPAGRVSHKVDLHGNHSIVALVDRVLALGMGESLVISGRREENETYFSEAAIALCKALRAGFDGVTYAVLGSGGRKALDAAYDPETTITGGGEGDCAFMREMIKRTVERGENAAVVLADPDRDARPFLDMAKAYEDASVTVIAFTREAFPADAHIAFDGGEIDGENTGNLLMAEICGKMRAAAAVKATRRIKRAKPDDFIEAFTKYVSKK